ncbi:MAG TPA: hypothetical protein G4N91_00585 [Dehalococcoidia bacterium]|nr:hypothetical protein [Dehalococcoidia bacterium]
MGNKVIEESVAEVKKMMQDLTPLDMEYIERYIASRRREGRLYPCSSVIKGNADAITESLRKCAQNDMMEGFSDVITLEIFYDTMTYSELDPPEADRPMVRLDLLNPQTDLFRSHDIFKSQDAYILVSHGTPDDEKQARLNRKLAEDKARSAGVKPQMLNQEIVCSSCGKRIGSVNEEQDDPVYRPRAASRCKVCNAYLCLDCYPGPTTGQEICPVCGVWHYAIETLVEWKY